MPRNGTPRRRPEAPSAPTTLTECARRYHACALALARSFGLPMTAEFLQEYHSAISCVYIEAGRAGVRLPPAVQLPPLSGPPAADPPAEAGEIMCTGMPPDPEAPTNGHTPPVAIPTDAGLPCGGQLIADLNPASLAMLINKTARLLQDGGERWVPLLHALQAERAARLAKGRKVPDPAHGGG